MAPFWLKSPLLALLLTALVCAAPVSAQEIAVPRELTCEDWRRFADADWHRHAETLNALDVCLSYEPVVAGGIVWRLVRLQRTAAVPAPAPLIIVLHDNEDAALVGALSVLALYDVQIVTIDADEDRLWQGVDPNRMSVEPGAIIDGCPNADALDAAFATAVLRDWTGRDPILSLHSNAPVIAGDGAGGRGSISLLRPGPGQLAFAGAPVATEPQLADPDNLIYITGPTAHPNLEQRTRIGQMQAAGLNVLYSRIDPRAQDCSLSDFLTLRGQSDLYFNVEVEEGSVSSALGLVRRLMGVLYPLPATRSDGT